MAGLEKHTKEDPKNIMVAKIPSSDACDFCKRLHLEGGKPRVFALAELKENGTNVGRKRRDWQAVVGPTHPWCSCAIVYVPSGWNFNKEHLLMPDKLQRSYMLDHDLRKAQDMTYTASVPDKGVVVRVADPRLREAVEAVLAKTPAEIFDKHIGVTLITTDMPRIQNPLEEHDLAYWTANEIRLMHDLDPEKVGRVLPHEIGHSLNVYLIAQLGSVPAVRKWHDELWAVSKDEGFVSKYAAREPIENAAEVTMLYLYDRARLMLEYPRQFSFCHKAYNGIFRKAHAQVSGENRTAV